MLNRLSASQRRAVSALMLLLSIAFVETSHAQTTVNVSTASQLQNAVAEANNAGGNRTIMVAPGTYTLSDTLYVNASNITIAGPAGQRANVIIQGDAMSADAKVGNVIRVAGKNFQLHDVTLQRSRWHLVQIVGDNDADGAILRDCILRDAYEQMVKVTIDTSKPSVTGDNGLVENCVFEYTAGIGPQYYIGGIDAHGAKNWVVRNNTFRSIASPNTSISEFAVHFWNGSANNLVERNTIVNCDRGVGFGLAERGNSGGIIRNNMIYHASGKGQFADVGISLHNSPNTQVYNNTIVLEHNYPDAIEYRFAGTQGVLIANNLVNKQISARDGASGSSKSNVTNASASWFKNAAVGDLHLASAVSSVVDKGQAVSGLTDDFDGDARVGSPDIGADEFGAGAIKPMPPTDLSVN